VTLSGGFALRAPRWEELDAVLALIRESEEVDEGEAESTADDLRADWRLPAVDLSRDAWVMTARDPSTSLPAGAAQGERIAGYTSIWQRVEGLRFESDGYTRPAYRRRGVGTALMRAVEQRAREQAKEGAKLRSPVNHANEAARQLLENEGYAPARFYWRMVIDLDSAPAAPERLEELRPRAFEPGRDDGAVHALIQEAFTDNYDFSPISLESWRASTIEREDFEPGLLLIAENRDAIVGAALCFEYEEAGWVRTLAVRRDWRRRGVALGLLRAAFAEFYRRGQRRAGLVVDSFNRTGAKELYERAGMRVERQHDGYGPGARNKERGTKEHGCL
jgi:mycothiol synthase